MSTPTWRDQFHRLQQRSIPWAHRDHYPRAASAEHNTDGTKAAAKKKFTAKGKPTPPTTKNRNKEDDKKTVPTHKVKSSAKWLFTLGSLTDVTESSNRAHWRSWGIKIRASSIAPLLSQLQSLDTLLDSACPPHVNDWADERIKHWSCRARACSDLISESDLQHEINNDCEILRLFIALWDPLDNGDNGANGETHLQSNGVGYSPRLPALRPEHPIHIPIHKMNRDGEYEYKDEAKAKAVPERMDMVIIPDFPIMYGLPKHQLYATKANVVQAIELKPIRTPHDSLMDAVAAFVQRGGEATAHIHLNGDVSFVLNKELEKIPYIHSALVHILDCAGYSVSLDLCAVPLFNGNAAFIARRLDGDLFVYAPQGWSRYGAMLSSGTLSHLEMMPSLIAMTINDKRYPRRPGDAGPANDVGERYDKATRVHRPDMEDMEDEEDVETTALPNFGKRESDELVAMDDYEDCETEDDWEATDEKNEDVEITALPNFGRPEIDDEPRWLVAMDDYEDCENNWEEEDEEDRKPDIH